jgi:hypothetical protein
MNSAFERRRTSQATSFAQKFRQAPHASLIWAALLFITVAAKGRFAICASVPIFLLALLF